MNTDVVAITPTGDITLGAVIEDVQVLDDSADPRVRTAVEANVNGLRGTRSTWRIEPNGRLSAVEFSSAPGGASQAQQRLGDSIKVTSVVFPDEPIGVGGVWESRLDIVLAGIRWNAITRYRLKALDNDVATIEVRRLMTAQRQTISVEPGTATELTHGIMETSGEIAISLHGLAQTGATRGSGQVEIRVARGRRSAGAVMFAEQTFYVKPLVGI